MPKRNLIEALREFRDRVQYHFNGGVPDTPEGDCINIALDAVEQLPEIHKLQQERDALAAHVERLREVVIEYHSENIASEEAVNELWEIHKQSPTTNLAERDAEVARKAFIAGCICGDKYGVFEWDRQADEYAECVKRGEI